MKIGIISEQGKGRKTKITKICDFGAVDIYRIDAGVKKGKKPSKRAIRKIAETLSAERITICVAEKEYSDISEYGITVADNGRDVLLRRAGEAALIFAKENRIDSDFLIDGGSFYNVYSASIFLLRRKRRIFIKNAAFAELSDEIFSETGAVVGCGEPADAIVISMNKSEGFLKFRELSADTSDFKVKAEEFDFPWLSAKAAAALASILEKSGFLEKNRVKIEYFSNKIVNS